MVGIVIDYKDVKEKLKIRVLEKRDLKDIQNLKKLIEWSENDK